MRQGCIISPWLFNVYMDVVMKEYKTGMGRGGVRLPKEGRGQRLLGLLYADDLVLCGDLEEDLRAIVGRFIEVCRRRGLKVNEGKSKVMLLGREKELKCEVCVGRLRLERASEFEYLGSVLDKSCTDEAECSKMASGRRVAGAIRCLVNARSFQLECARFWHELLLVPVLT